MVNTSIVISGLLVLASVFACSYTTDNKSTKSECQVETNYEITGKFIELDNMRVYETGNQSSGRCIIVGYDGFGLLNNNNIQQLADKIANCFNYRVVIPDFYRGVAVNLTTFTPDQMPDAYAMIAERGNWTKTVKKDFVTVMDHYKTSEGIREFGVMGFCWGGYLSTQASINFPELKAAGLIHPSLVFPQEAEKVQVPMILLPSKDEPDMEPFLRTLQQKFGKNCGLRVFDDMPHGFAGAQANFSNPLNKHRVDQVIQILGDFFDTNFNASMH